jgi:hypothetical protein
MGQGILLGLGMGQGPKNRVPWDIGMGLLGWDKFANLFQHSPLIWKNWWLISSLYVNLHRYSRQIHGRLEKQDEINGHIHFKASSQPQCIK